jgi:hypothetical protein
MKLLIKNINKTSRCLSFSGIYLLLEVAARGAGSEPATPQPHARMGVGVGTGTRRRTLVAASPGWGHTVAARTSGGRSQGKDTGRRRRSRLPIAGRWDGSPESGFGETIDWDKIS